MKKLLTILSLLTCLLLLLVSCGIFGKSDDANSTDASDTNSSQITTDGEDAGTKAPSVTDEKTPGDGTTGSGHLNNGGGNTETGWGFLHPVR